MSAKRLIHDPVSTRIVGVISASGRVASRVECPSKVQSHIRLAQDQNHGRFRALSVEGDGPLAFYDQSCVSKSSSDSDSLQDIGKTDR